MDEKSLRMVERGKQPGLPEVRAWIGAKAYARWERVTLMIAERYPGIFVPEWLYGGKKHGWSLRYKKGRSFCTLIPEKGCLKLVIVFGAEERAKVEDRIHDLSPAVREQYRKAATYHDGKWLLLTVASNKVINDIGLLLAVKRKPKGTR
jgi:hypothetical protein